MERLTLQGSYYHFPDSHVNSSEGCARSGSIGVQYFIDRQMCCVTNKIVIVSENSLAAAGVHS